MTVPKLKLVNLKKEFDNGAVAAVDGIDLSVETGETIALLGPSGCGKSTILNMIVGLDEPTSGDIQIDDQSIVHVPPGKRNVGLVFQDYAVFTSMTVRQNLSFGLEVRHVAKPKITRAVNEVAELLDMSDRLDARAKDLGGSELQRVAIGRTLVTKPEIMLLDEPLSNLETAARLAVRKELRRLQSEIGLTIIYVTHDQIEALSLAHRIAVMRAGKILQVEKASVICDRPDHIFVAGFLGSPPMNLLRGHFEMGENNMVFRKLSFSLPVTDASATDSAVPEGFFTLGIRPELLQLVPKETAPLVGQVRLVEPRGSEVVLTVEVASEKLKVVAPSVGYPKEGEAVGLSVDLDRLVFFDGNTNRLCDVCLSGRPS
ncbi:MAG: ABC transporter ATP-binding protein [Desulfobacteraceae bacterium]|nr:ABC transporter ATP-binding protein [Desulfobacteraceae bacterium]